MFFHGLTRLFMGVEEGLPCLLLQALGGSGGVFCLRCWFVREGEYCGSDCALF